MLSSRNDKGIGALTGLQSSGSRGGTTSGVALMTINIGDRCPPHGNMKENRKAVMWRRLKETRVLLVKAAAAHAGPRGGSGGY